jgi:signal transduction histidine kinase
MTLPSAIFLVGFGFESRPGRRLIDGALALSLIMYVAGIVHDFLLKLGVHEQGIYVFRYVSFVLLVGIFAIVVKRQSAIADALDMSNERLRRRLREQEAVLADYHHREAEALQLRAAEAERERITADLHDGMAGYLATIVALSEHDVSDGTEISNLAKDALTDLRFVIDATSISSPELRLTLAILRERCLQPLDALGIELRWSMIGLPDDLCLSHEDNLHVLRILQEALNNAVRHGRPKMIEVTGRSVPDTHGDMLVELILENRGGLAPEPGREETGHGTVNMAKRVAALGGEIDVTALPDGARLRLVFPENR